MNTIENLKKNLEAHKDWLLRELVILRIGRANPALVEDIMVDCYGSKMSIKQLAAISAPEPKVLVIQPWDKNTISMIEKAIQTSSLGLNPIVDRDIIRISIPSLTEERRLALVKVVKEKLEEAKISVRKDRDETIKAVESLFTGKKITEDEKFRQKQETQKVIDGVNKNLEDIADRKEKEIREL